MMIQDSEQYDISDQSISRTKEDMGKPVVLPLLPCDIAVIGQCWLDTYSEQVAFWSAKLPLLYVADIFQIVVSYLAGRYVCFVSQEPTKHDLLLSKTKETVPYIRDTPEEK